MNKRLKATILRHKELVNAYPSKSHPAVVRCKLGKVDCKAGLYADQLRVILEAKNPRFMPDLVGMDADVRDKTKRAFEYALQEDPRSAVECLKKLPRVGVSVASAILSWAYPGTTYPVIDRHAWRVFEFFFSIPTDIQRNPTATSVTTDQYLHYRQTLLNFVKNDLNDVKDGNGVEFTVSTVDYWMYAFSKTFGSGLGEQHWSGKLVAWKVVE